MFKQFLLFCFAIKLIVFCGSTNAISDSRREGRLLGATLISRQQINSNFQGSGSIAIGYSAEGTSIGIIFDKDTFVTVDYMETFDDIYVSELTAPYENGQMRQMVKDDDGEKYAAITSAVDFGPERSTLSAIKFEPLPETSKAWLATLPPDGSSPPTPGTKGCVAYGFNEYKRTDGSDPTLNVLGYLPLTIKPFQDCKDRSNAAQDEELQFCGTFDSAKQPYCHDRDELDYPTIVMCPAATLRRQYKKEGKFIKERMGLGVHLNLNLCHLNLWWMWWCPEEDDSDKDSWITVGIVRSYSIPHKCEPPTENDAILVFSFMGNLNETNNS